MFVHPPIQPSQSYRGGPPLQAQEEEGEGKHDFREAAAGVLGGFGTRGGGRVPLFPTDILVDTNLDLFSGEIRLT